MKLLFILDPLASLQTYKDSSLAMMRAAKKAGHTIYVCEQHDMRLQHQNVVFDTQTFDFSGDDVKWYQLGQTETLRPTDFDAILMRKDPPFDNEYLYSTYLLELAQQQGGCIINDPQSVRSWNEKLSIARFPQFAPTFIVTANNDKIRDFLAEHQDIIVKPLDGMGGAGIFRLTQQDPNIGAILETATNHGKQTIMAQRYLPEIKQGDKRIIVINGDPLPFALARIPKTGETRGNLAAGGKGVAQALSDRDLEIANTVGQTLKTAGLFFVGLDVIGDDLTEINVTSPTGIVEIATQTDCQAAEIFIQALETKIQHA